MPLRLIGSCPRRPPRPGCRAGPDETVRLVLGDDQRRCEAYDVRRDRVDQETRILSRLLRLRRDGLGEHDTQEQPRSADVLDERMPERLDPVTQPGAHALHVREQILVRDGVHDRQSGRAGDRVAAERGAVLTRRQEPGGVAEEQRRAERQAAPEALGQGDDVRFHTLGLAREPVAGASDACLDLVDDQERAGGAGDLAGGGQIPLGWHDDAVLALHRLDDDQRGVRGDGGPQCLRVAVGHVRDVSGQRLERCLLGRLPGEGQRPHGAAVETALGGDHVRTAGAPPRLDRRLDGLRAGVAEVDAARAARQFQQPLGQRDGRFGDEEVGHVSQRGDLFGDGPDDRGVRGAQRVDGDAADEVGVRPALGVPERGAHAPGQRHARRAVVVHEGGLPAVRECRVGCLDGAGGGGGGVGHGAPGVHGVASPSCLSGTTMVPMPSSVKISSRIACCTLPSSTRAVRTPLRTACRQPSILGTIPLARSGQQLLQLGRGEFADDLVAVRPVRVQALHVGEHHQRLGAQGRGERGGGGVGVDVVDVVVVRAAGDGGDDRDAAVLQQRLDRSGVDAVDLADPADVDEFARRPVRSAWWPP